VTYSQFQHFIGQYTQYGLKRNSKSRGVESHTVEIEGGKHFSTKWPGIRVLPGISMIITTYKEITIVLRVIRASDLLKSWISCILALRYPVLHWHTPFWHIVFPKTSEQKLFSLRQFCPKNNGWVSKKCFSLQYVMFILKTTRMWSGSHKQRPLSPHRLFCPLQRVCIVCSSIYDSDYPFGIFKYFFFTSQTINLKGKGVLSL
jgi:hypothetical protein